MHLDNNNNNNNNRLSFDDFSREDSLISNFSTISLKLSSSNLRFETLEEILSILVNRLVGRP